VLLAAVLGVGTEIERHIDAIEPFIAGLGPWGAVVFVGLFVVATSLFFPESVLGIIAGPLSGTVAPALPV